VGAVEEEIAESDEDDHREEAGVVEFGQIEEGVVGAVGENRDRQDGDEVVDARDAARAGAEKGEAVGAGEGDVEEVRGKEAAGRAGGGGHGEIAAVFLDGEAEADEARDDERFQFVVTADQEGKQREEKEEFAEFFAGADAGDVVGEGAQGILGGREVQDFVLHDHQKHGRDRADRAQDQAGEAEPEVARAWRGDFAEVNEKQAPAERGDEGHENDGVVVGGELDGDDASRMPSQFRAPTAAASATCGVK
jgi:hypothetical protein